MRLRDHQQEGESTRSRSRRRGGTESGRTDSDRPDRRSAGDTAESAITDDRHPSRRASDAISRLFADDARQPTVTDDPRLEREAEQTGERATTNAIRRRLADSGARLHTGPDADRTAERLDARAFTVGRDVGFARGAFAPETPAGRRLLGHELAHVDQQTAGRAVGVQRQATGTSKTDPKAPKAKPSSESSSATGTAQSGPAALGAFDESARQRVQANVKVIAGQDRIDVNAALNGPDSLSDTDVRVTGAGDASLETVLSKTGIHAVSKSILERDETMTLALDLTPAKAQLVGYRGPMQIAVRLSHVGTFGSAHSTITVENLGKLDDSGRKAVRTAGEQTATKRGFRFERFGKSEQAMVYEALGLLPSAVLDELSKGSTPLTFRRGSTSTSTPTAAGHYEQGTHTVVLFDSAFQSSQRRYGEGGRFVTESIRVIAHEVGHAVAETEPRVAAETDDAKSTGKTRRALGRATSATGWRWKSGQSWDYQHATTKTDFTTALKADATRPEKGKPKGHVSITDYPTTYSATGERLREIYAESFSLYVTDPATLKRLRPAVYAYFETRYGSPATAATKGSKSGSKSK